jgi:hypothetical protein
MRFHDRHVQQAGKRALVKASIRSFSLGLSGEMGVGSGIDWPCQKRD